jgi:hypothetical protein
MKINKGELDPTLVGKIERLDSVVDGFVDEDKSGFLSYNGKDFVVRRVNDSSFRRMFSESDVRRMEDSLYNESGLIRNSFRSNFNTSNQASAAFRSQVVRPKEETMYVSDSQIVLSRHVGDSLVFVNSKGILVKIDIKTGKTVGAADVKKELTSNFAVTSKAAFDFLAMEPYGEGVLLSTSGNGVLYYDFSSKKLEVKFSENGVTMIRNLGKGTVMCAADRIDNNVMFFSFETGMKLESSNALKRGTFQNPAISDVYKDHLFIVGRPYAANTTLGLLHHWERDKAGISMENSDLSLHQGRDYLNHSVKHLLVTDDSVYVSGLTGHGKLFVWQYDIKRLSEPFKEIRIEGLSFEAVDFLDFSDQFIVVGSGKNLYFLGADSSIERNLLLSERIQEIFFSGDDELVQVSGSKILKVRIPKYTESREISLEVYRSESHCNNIDLLIKGCSGKEKFSIFNPDTLEQISPSYIANYQDKTIAKISGSGAKAIALKMSVEPGTRIEGVAVNPDRLFLK